MYIDVKLYGTQNLYLSSDFLNHSSEVMHAVIKIFIQKVQAKYCPTFCHKNIISSKDININFLILKKVSK